MLFFILDMLNNKPEEGDVQRVKIHWAAVIWISGREVELKGLWDLGWSRKEDLGESKKKKKPEFPVSFT